MSDRVYDITRITRAIRPHGWTPPPDARLVLQFVEIGEQFVEIGEGDADCLLYAVTNHADGEVANLIAEFELPTHIAKWLERWLAFATPPEAT